MVSRDVRLGGGIRGFGSGGNSNCVVERILPLRVHSSLDVLCLCKRKDLLSSLEMVERVVLVGMER